MRSSCEADKTTVLWLREQLSQHLGERIVCSLTDIDFKPDLCRLLENACYRVVLFTFVWYPPLSPVFCFDSPQCSFPCSSFNVFNDLTRYMKKAMLMLIRNSLSFATHQTWPCVLNLELNVHLTFLLSVLGVYALNVNNSLCKMLPSS